jgi:hypothetical protein
MSVNDFMSQVSQVGIVRVGMSGVGAAGEASAALRPRDSITPSAPEDRQAWCYARPMLAGK